MILAFIPGIYAIFLPYSFPRKQTAQPLRKFITQKDAFLGLSPRFLMDFFYFPAKILQILFFISSFFFPPTAGTPAKILGVYITQKFRSYVFLSPIRTGGESISPTVYCLSLKKSSYLKFLDFSQLLVADTPMKFFFLKNLVYTL